MVNSFMNFFSHHSLQRRPIMMISIINLIINSFSCSSGWISWYKPLDSWLMSKTNNTFPQTTVYALIILKIKVNIHSFNSIIASFICSLTRIKCRCGVNLFFKMTFKISFFFHIICCSIAAIERHERVYRRADKCEKVVFRRMFKKGK